VVARIAGRAGIDDQHAAEAFHHLAVGVAVEDEIRLRLGEARELRVARMDIGAARLPRGRMHEQHSLAAAVQFDAVRPLREPIEERRVDAHPRPRSLAERTEKTFLVVAKDGVRLMFPEQRDDVVREAVFPDAVAKADQFVDIAHQPHRRELTVGGKRLLLVHSTPWEPRGTYVHPESGLLARFAEAEADFVLYGHTHQQVVQRIGKVLVINPGSTGEARDHRNGGQLSCAVLDTASEAVQLFDFPDPRAA
jgi:hypothetical protein